MKMEDEQLYPKGVLKKHLFFAVFRTNSLQLETSYSNNIKLLYSINFQNKCQQNHSNLYDAVHIY